MESQSNTLTQDLQTLTERWGGWKAPIHAVGAKPMDMRALQMMQDDLYYVPKAGRLASVEGHVANALALPACTFADLDHLMTRDLQRCSLEGLIRAYAATGGSLTTTHAVRKARRNGRITPNVVRFLSFCASFL